MALSFDPGKIFTIVGKNGCGKSTLLKSCAGLLQPKDGAVLLDGKELSGYSDCERAQKLSYLSQSRNTPNITVERLMAHSRFPHLGYPKKLREEDRAIISQSIRLLQLEEFRDKSLITLSGGERQRVYLAMQIAQDAPFLLLDEPTTYLDIEYQLMLMDLLAELKQQGKTIVMVLHDLDRHYDIATASSPLTTKRISTPEHRVRSLTVERSVRYSMWTSDEASIHLNEKCPTAKRSEAKIREF